jgi:hypothetical protein
MRPRAGFLAAHGFVAAAIVSMAAAQDGEAARPKINFSNRWEEDWSVLADPRLRTGLLDSLKYIPLFPGDPASYVSLGLTVRERFESNYAPSFGVGNSKGDSYLLDRVQPHVGIRPNAHWQIFGALEDVRAPWKAVITPVDENPLDLRLAFVAYTGPLAGGEVKARIGRQQMAFDLQRFVSIRDGPNVQQAFDALWLDWERDLWRVIAFWSRPVQYRHEHPFDDFSADDFQFGGFRVERKNVGPGELSAYYSRFQLDDASYLDASGDERRDNFDVGDAIRRAGGRDADYVSVQLDARRGRSSRGLHVRGLDDPVDPDRFHVRPRARHGPELADLAGDHSGGRAAPRSLGCGDAQLLDGQHRPGGWAGPWRRPARIG